MQQLIKQWLFLTGIGLSCLLPSGSVLSAIEGTRLVGLAMHQDTGRNIYIGALHYDDQIPKPEDIVTATGPRAMEFKVVARRTSIRSLMGSILLQGELAAGAPPTTNTTNFVGKIMGAVKGSLYAGDSLEIRLNKDDSVTAVLDGHKLTRASDRAVADYLLMGWVGEGGPSTAFRSSILATDINRSLVPVYDAHTVSEQRIAAIGSWNTPDKPSGKELVAVTQTSAVAAAVAALPVTDESTDTTVPAPDDSAIVTPAPAVAQDESSASEVAAPEVAASSPTMTPTATSAESLPPGPPDTSAASKKIEELSPDAQSAEPVLLASISPSREMIRPLLEEAQVVDVIDPIEYSMRLASFNTRVLRSVYAQIRYPKAAVRRNIQGSLELDLSVDKNGKLLDVSIAVPSGHSMLDKSAVKAAIQAFSDSPLEHIDEVAVSEYSEDGERLVIPIPVSFILTE